MTGGVAPTRPRRRRRTPEEAEREIIAAAESFLRERPFREMTVDEVMRRTDLSRPSFYVYFRDRHHLVLRVVEHIAGDLFEIASSWFQGGADGPSEVRTALEGVAPAFVEHGPVLQALADAAADDPDVESVYSGMVRGFVDATARHIDEEIAAGNTLPVDPEETAKALIFLNERYLLDATGGRGPGTDPGKVVETLSRIWIRTLYGER